MNNKLIKIQEMLMRQMERLDDNELMQYNNAREIARGNTLSGNATTFLKSVNVGMRVIDMANKYEMKEEAIAKKIGIE